MGYSQLCNKIFNFGTVHSNVRTQPITKITIHHMAGNIDAYECARMHYTRREASANYYIGNDGTIVGGVDENRRAWTSSSNWNDQRAITIEVANCKYEPNWEISNKAYDSLIKLCVDICKRYNIVPGYDGTKDATFTEHRMFAATLCPGPYLHGKMKDIVKAVAAGLNPKPQTLYRVQVGAFTKKANADNYAKEIKGKGFDTIVKKIGRYYKVQVGAFSQLKNAEAQLAKLKAAGYKDAFITE